MIIRNKNQVNESSQLLRQLSSPELPPPHLAAWQGKPDMLRDILQVIIVDNCTHPIFCNFRCNQIQTILMVASLIC